MKRLGTVLVLMAVLFAFAGPAKASSYYSAPSLPWFSNVNQCIGGQICGGTNNTINVYVPEVVIGDVYVYAHDNVGQTHKAKLELYVDGSFVARKDVLQGGGYITFSVSRFGSIVTLRSIHQDGFSS